MEKMAWKLRNLLELSIVKKLRVSVIGFRCIAQTMKS